MFFIEKCARCGVKSDRVRLFDAIYEGSMDLLCERCSIIENIPLIKKMGDSQLKESEKPYSVYERMKRLSGVSASPEQREVMRINEKLKRLDEHPELELPVKERPELIEHFHWEIMKVRRRKGFSQRQLSEMLGIFEGDIEMLEKGELGFDYEDTIRKIERFFNIRLIKNPVFVKERNPVLLDEYGRELDFIPEPKIDEDEEKEPEDEYTRQLIEKQESEDFDLSRADLTKVHLKDLRELHRRRIDATKQEQREEQKKIEEKQKVIEARKEELRTFKERESKELDNLLGGSELLNSEENSEKENKVDKLFDEAFEDED